MGANIISATETEVLVDLGASTLSQGLRFHARNKLSFLLRFFIKSQFPRLEELAVAPPKRLALWFARQNEQRWQKELPVL